MKTQYTLRNLMRRALLIGSEDERKRIVAFSIAYEGWVSLDANLGVEIGLVNTDLDLLQRFVQLVGCGKISKCTLHKGKQQYRWRIQSKPECAKMLTYLVEYMPCNRKLEVAQLVLKVCNRVPYSPITGDELRIIARVRELNKKGDNTWKHTQ
jgi:hypothetical protein